MLCNAFGVEHRRETPEFFPVWGWLGIPDRAWRPTHLLALRACMHWPVLLRCRLFFAHHSDFTVPFGTAS